MHISTPEHQVTTPDTKMPLTEIIGTRIVEKVAGNEYVANVKPHTRRWMGRGVLFGTPLMAFGTGFLFAHREVEDVSDPYVECAIAAVPKEVDRALAIEALVGCDIYDLPVNSPMLDNLADRVIREREARD